LFLVISCTVENKQLTTGAVYNMCVALHTVTKLTIRFTSLGGKTKVICSSKSEDDYK
jgi:hypothetical protein